MRDNNTSYVCKGPHYIVKKRIKFQFWQKLGEAYISTAIVVRTNYNIIKLKLFI